MNEGRLIKLIINYTPRGKTYVGRPRKARMKREWALSLTPEVQKRIQFIIKELDDSRFAVRG